MTDSPAPMTWPRLAAAIQANHPHAVVESPKQLRLVLVSQGTDATRVGLRLAATRAYGEPVVVIAADLGPGDQLDPLAALVTNGILAHGALAVADGVLEMRAIAFLRDLTERGFEIRLRALAAEAAELKARIGAPPDTANATDAFAHLAD